MQNNPPAGTAPRLTVKALPHTPGPWYVLADPVWVGKHPCHDARFITTSREVYTYTRDNDPGWAFEDPEALIICTLTDAEFQKGNAVLMAAAPELLEALQSCYVALSTMDNPSELAIAARIQAAAVLCLATRGPVC